MACPYGAIYFNEDRPHRRFQNDDAAAIPQCTATGKEVAEKTKTPIPYYNPAREETYAGVRTPSHNFNRTVISPTGDVTFTISRLLRPSVFASTGFILSTSSQFSSPGSTQYIALHEAFG